LVETVTSREPPRRHKLAMLELRVAVAATHVDGVWDVDSAVGEHVDDAVRRWLVALGPQVYLTLGMLSGDKIAIRPDQLAGVLTAQRLRGSTGAYCHITAASGHDLRIVDYSYRSAHVSLAAGTSGGPDGFDWPASLAAVIDGLQGLEPVAHAAFVHYTAASSALGAHGHRRLYQIENRSPLGIGGERLLEETGLVDAQGIVFLPTALDPVPHGWTSRAFGHLWRLEAPDLDAWLAGSPSDDIINGGRAALAPLLHGRVPDGFG
jgi:hypothetical protein